MPQPEQEMRNPFRNEADAFRVLVMIVVVAAVVIAATLLVASWLGVAIGLIGIAVGIYATVGWLRMGLAEREEGDPGEPAEGQAPRG